MSSPHVQVVINGKPTQLPAHGSLLDLLARFDLDPGAVVVEHNRTIVRRPKLAGTTVHDGDQVELVHFVGGG
ncbi:MAG TPA: sulfur carrier protein ThiS [Gemmatimonadales bacterium]